MTMFDERVVLEYKSARLQPLEAAKLLGLEQNSSEADIEAAFKAAYVDVFGHSGLSSDVGANRLQKAIDDFRTHGILADFVAYHCAARAVYAKKH